MDKITDILVIVDPLARDQPAVAKAAALARSLGAAIELLICDTKRSRPGSDALIAGPLDSILEEMAEPLRDDGIDVTTHAISGDPLHEAVIAWMRNSPADLLIKDTHHHSFVRRAFVDHSDWHMIRACPLPLLLAKPTIWDTRPVIMAAVDPGHAHDPSAGLDHHILDVAASLAKQLDAPLHAMHAYSTATIATAAVGGMPPIVVVSAEALGAEHALNRSRIRQITDQYGIEDANLHVDAAVPAEYLPRMAGECHADIVVMGAIARSGLKRVFLGSTAERVLEALPCDVLVVKSPDFAHNLPF
jgi:universal stress protein E